jgi:hypothetical protein
MARVDNRSSIRTGCLDEAFASASPTRPAGQGRENSLGCPFEPLGCLCGLEIADDRPEVELPHVGLILGPGEGSHRVGSPMSYDIRLAGQEVSLDVVAERSSIWCD